MILAYIQTLKRNNKKGGTEEVFRLVLESLKSDIDESAKWRAQRALRALRAHASYVLYVLTPPTCPTCPRAQVYFTDRKI